MPPSPNWGGFLGRGRPPQAPGGHSSPPTPPPTDAAALPTAVLRSGSNLEPGLSPRPYVHPVSTPAGIVVTDHLPSDHVWHLGAGFALQDVNGSNFWGGGRSYRRTAGKYVDLKDHGRIEIASVAREEDATTLDLNWLASDGSLVLNERRSLSRTLLDARTWRLEIQTRLTAVVDVSLGSPGSHGAAGSGYGGFFWRLPVNASSRVFSSTAEGEPSVHGSVAPWLAWAGEFDGGPATLVFGAPSESADPWFVRCSDYPAVGSAWHGMPRWNWRQGLPSPVPTLCGSATESWMWPRSRAWFQADECSLTRCEARPAWYLP